MVHGSTTVSSEILSVTHARDPHRDVCLPLLLPTLLPTPSVPPSLDPPQDASTPAAPPSILSTTDTSLSSAPPSSPHHPPRHHRIHPNNGRMEASWLEGIVHLDPHLHHAPARTVAQAPPQNLARTVPPISRCPRLPPPP
jgi:hypothetical protein